MNSRDIFGPSIASRSSSPGHRDHVDLDRPIRQVDLVIGVTARVLCSYPQDVPELEEKGIK